MNKLGGSLQQRSTTSTVSAYKGRGGLYSHTRRLQVGNKKFVRTVDCARSSYAFSVALNLVGEGAEFLPPPPQPPGSKDEVR